jgi:undecaprenyl-diphosphatase
MTLLRNLKQRAGLIATLAVTFVLVGWIGRHALRPWLTNFDQAILHQVAAVRRPLVTGWMGVLSAVGAGSIAIPLAIVLGWALYRLDRWRTARCYLIAVVSTWLLNESLKLLFQRPRPAILMHLDTVTSFSYPSGHAMLAPVIFGLGAILLTRRSRRWIARAGIITGVLLTSSIAFSRVYLAVHYPSDVLAGLLAGIGWAAAVVTVCGPTENVTEASRRGGNRPSRRWQ